MKYSIALITVLILSSFTPPQQPKELNIKLTVEDINTVLTALSKQPYEQAAPLIQKIALQAQKQLTDTRGKKK